MRILVNHLTRMQPGYICVAGIDPATRKHVRPVWYGRLTRDLLASEGGVFAIGAEVDLGEAEAVGEPPEMEDHRFNRWRVRYVGTAAPADYWRQLEQVARASLHDIFGAALHPVGARFAVERGEGAASLGCLQLPTRSTPPRLMLDNFGKVRLLFHTGEIAIPSPSATSAPVTDVRLYDADQQTPRRQVIERLNQRLQRGAPVILAVGLSRAYGASGASGRTPAEAPRHWLMVNNLHLQDQPIWNWGDAQV